MPCPIYELLTKGQTVLINGSRNSYRFVKALKESVFQASTVGTNKPVIVKTDNGVPGIYQMEVNCYEFQCIQNSPHIRSIREVIDNGEDQCMVFEWMDTDLWSLRARARELGQPFFKVAAKSILEAVRVFSDMDGQDPVVHTDINPNNVLVSDVDSQKPIVKAIRSWSRYVLEHVLPLEYLNMSMLRKNSPVIPSEGFDEWQLQGLAIRAPETWKGVLPAPPCDVWSVGVTLAHFLAARALFGPDDQDSHAPSLPKETNQTAWSIGKIIQLLGPLERDEDPKYKMEFDVAELFERRCIIKMGSLEKGLSNVNASPDCISLIRYLLTLDHKTRPTAEEALQHPWPQGLE